MTEITLHLEPAVLLFYARIASAAGKSLEQDLPRRLIHIADEAHPQEEAAECVFLVIHFLLLGVDPLLILSHFA